MDNEVVTQELAYFVFQELLRTPKEKQMSKIGELVTLIDDHWKLMLLTSYQKEEKFRQFFMQQQTVYHPAIVIQDK